MHDSKLLQTYKTFSPSELPQWSLFVHSPFFNKDPHILRLVDLINLYFPDLHHPELMMSKAYGHVYETSPYNQNKFRKLMSKTLDLIKQFWLHSYLKEDVQTKNKYELKAYKEKGLHNRYKKIILQQINILEERNAKETEDYLQLSKLYEKVYRDQKLLTLKDADQYFVLATDTHIEYQQIQNFIYSLSWIDKVKVIEIDIPTSIKNLKEVDLVQSITTTILLQFKTLLEDPEKEVSSVFNTCFESLKKHHTNMGRNIVHYLVRLLLNHLSRLERLNIKTSIVENQIMNWGIQHNHFLYNGILSNALFTNICFRYFHENKFEEAQRFIDNNKDKLPPRTANEYVLFVTALLHFNQEKFDYALDILNNFYAGYDDQLEMLRRQCLVYCLLEKVLVSRNILSLLQSQLASFSKYLKYNNQLTTAKKSPFKVFIRYIWKIVRLYNSLKIKSHRLDNLIKELQQESKLGLNSIIWINKYLEKMRKHHT